MTRPTQRLAVALLASTTLCGPALAQQIGGGPMTPNGAAALQSSAVVYADFQIGADWCAKVSAAMNLLPSTGGIVDARGLTGAQNCATGLTIANDVTVLAGAATINLTAPITMTNSSALDCPATGRGIGSIGLAGGPTIFHQPSGTNLPIFLYVPGGKTGMRNCVFDGGKGGQTSGTALAEITGSWGTWENVTLQNGAGDDLQIISVGTSLTVSSWIFDHVDLVTAAKRGVYCSGNGDSTWFAPYVEANGGAGLDLNSCGTMRLVSPDIGGNGQNVFVGSAGAQITATGVVSPGIYIHGIPYKTNVAVGSMGHMIHGGQYGNNYGQPILIDGSDPQQTATLGGSTTPGDTVSLTFSGSYLNGGTAVTVSYTTVSGDTSSTIACELAWGNQTCATPATGGVNGNATLAGYGIAAATSANVDVLYIPANPIPVTTAGAAPTATDVTVSESVSGAATETVALGTLTTYGDGAYAEQIDDIYVWASGSWLPPSIFYGVEAYNSAGGANKISEIINSGSTYTYAGAFLIHGASSSLVGNDNVGPVEASGTFGSSVLSSIFAGYGGKTNIQNACYSGNIQCLNQGQNVFTSSVSGGAALTAATLGTSAADDLALVVANPSTASYGNANMNWNVGALTIGSTLFQRDNNTDAGTRFDYTYSTTGTKQLAAEIGGVPPVENTGSCSSVGSAKGYFTAGTFKLTAACSSGTVIISALGTAPDGWICPNPKDDTTPADYWTAYASNSTTSSATFTGTGASGDVIEFGPCVPF